MSIAVLWFTLLFPVQDKPTSNPGRATCTDWGFFGFLKKNASIVYFSTPRPVTPTSITISVDQSPSERYSHSAAQDMTRLVCNLKMQCSVHKSPYFLASYFSQVHFNIIISRMYIFHSFFFVEVLWLQFCTHVLSMTCVLQHNANATQLPYINEHEDGVCLNTLHTVGVWSVMACLDVLWD